MTPVQRSILFSAVERYASVLLSFLATAILSRLLTPAEFGTYAVVSALTAVIAAAFQEFGGANYLIQKKDLSPDSIRTAFTVTFVICTLVGIALYSLAGPVAQYFGQDGLRAGIAVSALNFLIVPFSGTLAALFRRKMEFGILALCNLVVGAASSLVAIVLALLNFSYMAPIWGGVAGNVILVVMLLIWHRDMTAFRPSFADYRDVVGFGLYSSAVSVINVFYNFAPQLFLARILDFASVGLYSRAVNITQVFDRLIVQVLNPVVMPAIVARRAAGEDLRAVYLEALQSLSAVQWPAMIFVAIMARSIILIWLGQNWLDIVPLIRFLCIANLALFAACLSYPVLVAIGRVRDALVSSLISLPPSLLVILCASFYGVEAVAASALLTLPFQAAVALYFIGGHLDVGFRDLVRALRKSIVVTVLTAIGVAACAALIDAGIINAVLGLVSACFVAGACWLLGMAITSHPLLHQLQHAANGFAAVAWRLRPWRPAP
ncbi:Membrane protein involved in the export of O-antigen and teichoic acid [Hyphomicrobiales bacterium]|nr:Membrane protein involved in the export of O-antigen and teichoic acid [Hyphomicrobiales bacterium]